MSEDEIEVEVLDFDYRLEAAKDLAERAGATFAQAAIGYVVDVAVFDSPAVWRTAALAGVAAVAKWALKEIRAWRQIRGDADL